MSTKRGEVHDVKVVASVGEHSVDVYSARTQPEAQIAWEVTGIEVHRATIRRIGGASPKVQLMTAYEGVISADVSELKLAQSLGQLLYDDVDATLEVVRDSTGRVRRAKLIAFSKLKAMDDPLGDIQAWFSPAGKLWDSLNYDEELRDAD